MYVSAWVKESAVGNKKQNYDYSNVIVLPCEFLRDGKYWPIDIGGQGYVTQGRSNREVVVMAADWVRCTVDDDHLPVFFKWVARDSFELALPPTPGVMAFIAKVVHSKFQEHRTAIDRVHQNRGKFGRHRLERDADGERCLVPEDDKPSQ